MGTNYITKGPIRGHAVFACAVVAAAIVYWKTLRDLAALAFSDQSYSHVAIIPAISLFLLYSERKKIFSSSQKSVGFGASVALLGLITSWLSSRFILASDANNILFSGALSLVCLWIGAFIACYGVRATRAAAFPLLFLFLMVPLPTRVLGETISLLQKGSTEIAYTAIRAMGVPVLRQGLYLSLPGLSIEVASECSGIRSSMALLITCLLASHYFLRTKWRQLFFVLLSLPFAIVKNGIRIATLAVLSVYVDPAFLNGHLHRDGGFVFFLLVLAMLWPVLIFLQKAENRRDPPASDAPQKGRSEFAQG